MLCRRQVITRLEIMSDGRNIRCATRPYDISIPAINAAMEIYGVKDKQDCLAKVIKTFHNMLSETIEI